MPYISDTVFDTGLAVITSGGTRIDICSQEPTSYGQATTAGTYSLGNKTGLTTGAAQDGATNGRRVIVPAIGSGSPGTVSNTGTATHWALTNGSSTLVCDRGVDEQSRRSLQPIRSPLDAIIAITIADAT